MAGYRVSREDGLWYVENDDRTSWWTVNDDLNCVTNGRGQVLNTNGPTAQKIIRAVVYEKNRMNL